MKNFILLYSYDAETGCRDEPFDDGPYSGYDHTVWTSHEFQLYRCEGSYPVYPEGRGYNSSEEWKQIDPDLEGYDGPFVVVANLYSDGGTFGSTDGYVDLIGVFKSSEKEKIKKAKESAERMDYGYFGSLNEVLFMEFQDAPWLESRVRLF